MSRKIEIVDDEWKAGISNGIRTNQEYRYHEGVVGTPYGFVWVYAQGCNKYAPSSRLDFIWNGRRHSRWFRNKRYSKRGLVTKARQFALEIANA